VKAIVIEQPGGPEQLVHRDWPDPTIDRHEVLVELKAAALNHADIWLRQGSKWVAPIVPGIDGAGVVIEVGAEVDDVRVGQRVLIDPVVTCGRCPYCLRGDQGTCAQRQALGQTLDGTYAELVKAPATNVHSVADAISFEEAAAVPSAFFTAWQTLMIRAVIRAGEDVVITAAGGGVGSAAVQVAALAGARVIAAAGSPPKLELARQLGAHDTIDYEREDLGQRILELTDGRGAHVILDLVGATLWDSYMQGIGRGGRIVLSGFTGGQHVPLDVRRILGRRLSLLGSGPQGAKAEVRTVMSRPGRRPGRAGGHGGPSSLREAGATTMTDASWTCGKQSR
jgi:NADPH:quinone reductase-like Zn-dependent oxidoreductase